MELATTASRVLADTAFVMTELDVDSTPDAAGWIHASVGFRAEIPGRLVLSMAQSVATQAAADMLCTEPDDPAAGDQAGGAVLELANVLTSVVIAQMFGTKGSWQFGIPERLVELPAAYSSELTRSVTLRTDSLEPIRVQLLLGEGATA
jgi:CheY-specific phosphatase CheX